jgi:hypothetical protein
VERVPIAGRQRRHLPSQLFAPVAFHPESTLAARAHWQNGQQQGAATVAAHAADGNPRTASATAQRPSFRTMFSSFGAATPPLYRV